MKTPEMCLAAVTWSGLALEFVPKHMKTPKLCLEAVCEEGDALKFISENTITPEMCRMAVLMHGRKTLKFIPEKFKEMCKNIVPMV